MEPIAEEIYILVKKKMAEQAAFTIDAYEELIDETIDYFKEKGKLTDEDNDEFIKDQLMEMWEVAEQGMVDKDKYGSDADEDNTYTGYENEKNPYRLSDYDTVYKDEYGDGDEEEY